MKRSTFEPDDDSISPPQATQFVKHGPEPGGKEKGWVRAGAQGFDAVERSRAVLDASFSRPSEARVYDYYLGGACNWAVDREFAAGVIAQLPDVPMAARENRRFLHRAVRYLVAQGVRQFVDLGPGMSTVGNVHHIADQDSSAECSVVYVDRDPIACAHAARQLEDDGVTTRHRVIEADLLETTAAWRAILHSGVINSSEPVGLLMIAVLHFIPDSHQLQQAMRYYRARLPHGSYLVLSHANAEGRDRQERETMDSITGLYAKHATSPAMMRSRDELATFFGNWPLVEPGLAFAPEWRQDGDNGEKESLADPSRSMNLVGMARKP